MKVDNIILTILTIAILLSALLLFFNKKILSQSFLKLFPLISILTFLLTIISLIIFYNIELTEQEKKYQQEEKIYRDLIFKDLNDYKNLTNRQKEQKIDSLNSYINSLKNIQHEINKQKNITGKGLSTLNAIANNLDKTDSAISLLNSYCEIIDSKTVLPSFKGYMTSGNTSNFELICPTDKKAEYIDFTLDFPDQKLINKIACIFVEVENNNVLLFEQTYLPHQGINKIKLRNYLKDPNVIVQIGYILKSESNKEYPNLQKITCKG